MAQANSVQREPSMEEILASIRRIIEDNDTGRRPAVDFGQVRPEPEDDRAERNVIEVEAFRAELQTAKAAPLETKPEAAPAKFEHVEREEVVVPAWPTIEPRKPVVIEPAAPVAEAIATARPITTATWTPSSTAAVEDMERLAGPASVVAVESEPAPVLQPAVDASVQEEVSLARPAIISEQAGKQVSAAFGELNEAYAARSRKSFDDIAAEMMRPMLQDWLDNNLPTLVERLVREEIERIARGSQ